MEQARRHLKISSIVVLLFAGFTLLNLIFELWFGDLNNAEIPAGSPDNILLITKILLLSISFVLLLPQLYIGIKGLKEAKSPTDSKGHIVWGMILFVLTLVGLISPAVAIIKREAVFENVSSLCSILVEVVVFFDYIKCARLVAQTK